jgi:tetratricopeptide (TPR) repeat protein
MPLGTDAMRKKIAYILILSICGGLLAGCQGQRVHGEASPAGEIPSPGPETLPSKAPAYYYFSAAQMKLKEGQAGEAQYYLEKAIQYDPKSAVLKLELADLLLLQQKPDKALDYIQQTLMDHPDHVDALILAGRIHMQRGELSEAKALFERALTQNPSDPNVYLHLGRIYWNENDLANAGRVFRHMVTSFPNSYAAYFFSGKVLAAQGKYDQAIAAFNNALALEPSLEEARFELIQLYRSQKQTDKVILAYEEILASNPENTMAAFELAAEYDRQGRKDLSNALLKSLGERSELDATILTYVFENYLETKQYDKAAWAVEGLLKGAPQSAELHYLAGVAYDGLKETQKALDHLSQVDSTSRFYQNAVVHQALLYRDMGKLDQSIAIIRQALVADPDSAEYYLYLGSFYEELERYDEALETLQRGATLDDQNHRIFFRMGVVHDKAGHKPAAIEAMKRVLQLQPEDVEALNFLGYTYAELGIHLDEAEALIQNALSKKPDDGYISDSLGWVYFKQGRYDEALKWLNRAADLVPDDPAILEHLGDLHQKLGHKEKALKYYRHSLEVQTKNRAQLEEKIRALTAKP